MFLKVLFFVFSLLTAHQHGMHCARPPISISILSVVVPRYFYLGA